MKFKYKAVKKDNEIIEGVIEGANKFTVAHDLRERGEIPLLVQEAETTKINFSFSNLGNMFSHVSLREKIVFTKNLFGMLSAGLSLSRSISILEKQTKNPAFKKILNKLGEDVNKGDTLSNSMKKFPKIFPGVFIAMVHSGEESGSLPKALSEVGDNLEKSYALNKKIKGAMTYPSIIFSAMILIGVLMLIYVVPTLTKTFKDIGATLPGSTRFIIWLSDSISNNVLLFILTIIGCIVSVILLARVAIVKRYFDFISIRLPVVGMIVKEMNSARTTRTLSSLLSSGVDMSEALSITKEVLQNSYYKEVIDTAIISIEKGQPLSEIFKSNSTLYPVMVGEMMEVGEETGKLSSMLVDIATFYESEVDAKTKDLSTVIEPVLMIFIGAAVGFFAVSMLTPMYSIMNNIN